MIVIDLETTGPDPKYCSVINIGAVDFDNPENRFFEECAIFEGAEISEFSLNYGGFNLEELMDKTRKSQKEVYVKLIEWVNNIEDQTFAGQNIRFDINFLDEMAERLGYKRPFGHRFLDLHSICYYHMIKTNKKIPLEKNISGINTDIVMEYVGIPTEPKPHKKGITGAIHEAEAFSRLIYGKNLLDEFKGFPVPDYLNK